MKEFKTDSGAPHPKQELLERLENLRVEMVSVSLLSRDDGMCEHAAKDIARVAGMLGSRIEGLRRYLQ